MQEEISFKVTGREEEIIHMIAKRAMADLQDARHSDKFTFLDIQMDVTATRANGNPLRLQELLDADGFNFAHDILGIRRHLNRETGKLEDFFSPRFSRRDRVAA